MARQSYLALFMGVLIVAPAATAGSVPHGNGTTKTPFNETQLNYVTGKLEKDGLTRHLAAKFVSNNGNTGVWSCFFGTQWAEFEVKLETGAVQHWCLKNDAASTITTLSDDRMALK